MLQQFFLLTLMTATSMARVDDWNPRRCWTSGNGQSVRWWPEYSEITRGRYWYECKNGRLEPKGCLDRQSRKLRIGESYDQKGYEMTCIQHHDGYMGFKMTACLPRNGGRYTPGEKWNEAQNRYWFICQQRQYSVRMKTGGCVTRSGERIKIGDERVVGNYWYECQHKYNGSVSLCAIGCVHNGNKYRIGQSWAEDDFVWYCKKDGEKTSKMCVGCQHFNKRLNDGEQYYERDTVFKCIVSPDAHYHKVIGCVQRDNYGTTTERVIGCHWTEQDYMGKYERTCLKDGGKGAKKETLGCVWVHKGVDYLSVPPNTYTIWFNGKDNKAIACRMEGGHMRLVEFEAHELAFKARGMKYKPPRAPSKK